jgi:hypothetical protein
MPEIGTSGSMSGDGKRGVAEWPKLPRPSSTLPKLPIWDLHSPVANGGKADNICEAPGDRRGVEGASPLR